MRPLPVSRCNATGSGTFFVPRRDIFYFFSNVNALQMRTTMTMPAQSRTQLSLRVSAGQVINLLRRALPQFFQKGVARIGNNSDICNAVHLKQATESPTASAAGIYFARVIRDIISSVPCGALMRPLPVSRCTATGSGTFSVSGVNYHTVSF